MSARLLSAAVLCLPLAACALPDAGTDPLSAPPTLRIADATQNGNQHFYFLPPLAWQPEYSGDFDGAAEPEVTICELSGSSCSGFVAYSMGADVAGETIQVDPASEFFHVNWRTDLFDLDVNTVYRIQVQVGGAEVGYLDVLLVDNRSQLRSGGRDGLISLVDGRTAPIKFRIEQGVGTPNEPQPPTEPDPPAVPEGAITGIVTDAAANGIGGIHVSAMALGSDVSDVTTNPDGTYVLPVPDALSDVIVKFADHPDNESYQAECYDDVPIPFCTFGAISVPRGSGSINAQLNLRP